MINNLTSNNSIVFEQIVFDNIYMYQIQSNAELFKWLVASGKQYSLQLIENINGSTPIERILTLNSILDVSNQGSNDPNIG